MILRKHLSMLPMFALFVASAATVSAQQKSLLPERISDSNYVVLAGNTRPEVSSAVDLGLLDESTSLPALQFVLKRSPESEAAFTRYVAELSDPKSANYHAWLTNAQIGARFGAAPADIAAVSKWLESKGFKVNSVSPDKTVIEFAGTAGLARTAFNAPIHKLLVEGQSHFANVKDPEIPSDLTPVVAGIASLHNFMPRPLYHARANTSAAKATPEGSGGSGYNYLGAADLATIYNFNGAFASGVTGSGQTIALLEDTNQYSLGDFTVFRKTLGLSRAYPQGNLTQVSPAGTNACANPGVNGDDVEAAIDVEWASAAAPNASIVNAACADTTQFGGFLALANLLQQPTFPTIVSISYGDAEALNGAAENLYINNLYKTAVAQGVSLYVSSGDEGAASADANRANATHGIGVSGFTSTPYNVSVGGTDFGYVPLGTPGNYFTGTNGAYFQTAVSYIPEVPWDDSCAGTLIATYLGYPTAGTGSLCNSSIASSKGLLTTGSGSGGPSGCATGAASTRGVVSGTCAGYPKPSWQSLVGVPADGVRDIPDVSLMASNGFWGVYYAVCISDPSYQSAPCGANPANWAGFGGTSISSPIWAGIQALVNQNLKTKASGLPNPVLYSLANNQYGATGSPACNSSKGNQVASNCVFYDVTQGDMAVNCTGTRNCYNSGGTYGVLSTSNSTLSPAYPAGTGWDFATGIGTTNVANIVKAWTAYASSSAVAAQ